MSIHNVLSTQPYDVFSTSENKPRENTGDAFSEFISKIEDIQTEEEAVLSEAFSGTFTDNGVNSALMFGRFFSQETRQDSGAATRIDLTEEDKLLWHNDKPEGIKFTGAGRPICNGGRKEYNSYFNVYYTAGSETVRQACSFYDTNSPEDSPVMYVWEYGCTPQSYGDDVLLRIEVNKINPANATYEEMIALAGYIYRDDPVAAGEASEAIDIARTYMEADGLDEQHGAHDFTSYYLPEVVRRSKNYPNPANRILADAAERLLEYLRDKDFGLIEI